MHVAQFFDSSLIKSDLLSLLGLSLVKSNPAGWINQFDFLKTTLPYCELKAVHEWCLCMFMLL